MNKQQQKKVTRLVLLTIFTTASVAVITKNFELCYIVTGITCLFSGIMNLVLERVVNKEESDEILIKKYEEESRTLRHLVLEREAYIDELESKIHGGDKKPLLNSIKPQENLW